jgi:predicted Zn-dependent protease with MMP-like domain
MHWSRWKAPSLDDFETLARTAFAALPEQFRTLCGDIVYIIQDFPDEDVIRDMELEDGFEILGLFQGPDIAARDSLYPAQTMIFLYRRPVLDYWAEHEETLESIVRHVLVHEIGHHFGLSDAAMHAIEEASD